MGPGQGMWLRVAVAALLLRPAGSVGGHCGGAAADHCLGRLVQHGLSVVGTTHAFVETCGDENPLEELLTSPERLAAGRTRLYLESGLRAPALGGLLDGLQLLKGHARRLLGLAVEFAYSCYELQACMPPREAHGDLRRGHAEFLQAASSLLARVSADGGEARWILGIGDPAQILARHAFGAHLEFAASVLSGLEAGMDPQTTVHVLHDLASRLAFARCEMQAQMLAHLTLVEIPPPQVAAPGAPLPRFEFFSGACCRRYHVLSRLLTQMLEGRGPGSGPLRILEVGVNNGITSQFLLSHFEGIRLDGVDPWIDRQAIYEEAQSRLERFGDRARLWRLPSAEAASRFDPGTFDLAFIDGDHAKDAVAVDIRAWRSRVRPGGLLAGHDLFNPAFEGVLEALLEHLREEAAAGGAAGGGGGGELPTVHFAADYLWWLDI